MNDITRSDIIGNIKISEEVIATIACVVAQGISGIAGMSAGLIDGLTGLLGKRTANKGVKITLGEHDVSVELAVVVDYGCEIPDVAWNVQQSVKKEIETMTGLAVTKVDIRVEAIAMPIEKEPEVVAAPVEQSCDCGCECDCDGGDTAGKTEEQA